MLDLINFRVEFPPYFQCVARQIPYSAEQGISSREQGILRADQGTRRGAATNREALRDRVARPSVRRRSRLPSPAAAAHASTRAWTGWPPSRSSPPGGG